MRFLHNGHSHGGFLEMRVCPGRAIRCHDVFVRETRVVVLSVSGECIELR